MNEVANSQVEESAAKENLNKRESLINTNKNKTDVTKDYSHDFEKIIKNPNNLKQLGGLVLQKEKNTFTN